MEACRKGLFMEAEANLLSALEQAGLRGSRCMEAKIQNNLGLFYELQANREKDRFHYENALRLMRTKLSTDHLLYARLTQSLARVSPYD